MTLPALLQPVGFACSSHCLSRNNGARSTRTCVRRFSNRWMGKFPHDASASPATIAAYSPKQGYSRCEEVVTEHECIGSLLSLDRHSSVVQNCRVNFMTELRILLFDSNICTLPTQRGPEPFYCRTWQDLCNSCLFIPRASCTKSEYHFASLQKSWQNDTELKIPKNMQVLFTAVENLLGTKVDTCAILFS